MSYGSFIPQYWSAVIMQRLQGAFVYTQPGIVNRNYEGEIRDAGDTVRINAVSPVTISDYTRNSDMSAPEELHSTSTTLVIDRAKSFFFQVDDVDRAQVLGNIMEAGMVEAAYGLADEEDQWAAALMVAGAAANNVVANSVPTSTTAWEKLVDLQVILKDNKVPGPYFCIVPPWFHALLQKDSRWSGNGTPANVGVLMNGQIGMAAGMTIIESTNVPNTAGASYKIIAGSSIATTVADQIVKTEALRLERRFADAVRGLHVYGGKVIRPEALAVLTVSKS